MHDGFTNKISFKQADKKIVLKPLSPKEVCEDQIKMREKKKSKTLERKIVRHLREKRVKHLRRKREERKKVKHLKGKREKTKRVTHLRENNFV